ncbi:MAG: L-serine ammonia-lyase, iron-sulfur-dependent, subunit alpha [Oscillospiraceae bacterium]|nr:L-serine ammonia-lyase, iron-sulfur-dependent, subunit alpha [Oscillospiraceae bacterium]
MKSIRELYKAGRGPSSSHTMGPVKAAEIFLARHSNADRFEVTLLGSLAKTGKGHGTDTAIIKCFRPKPCHVIFDRDTVPLAHENTLELRAFCGDECIGFLSALSVGGGDIVIEGEPHMREQDVYAENTFDEVAAVCEAEGLRLPDYVFSREPQLQEYLAEVWHTMRTAAQKGVQKTGTLPGGLGVQRRANALYSGEYAHEDAATHENRLVCAYAFAVSEQNADNGMIVTAPTCGACGVVPAVLLYMQEKFGYTDTQILRALAVGGLIGNIVKQNASISGAECGCQAEIGTACSMAAAALAELQGMQLAQIEYAAEVALEHHLGLTCDPVCGLVQIPCIERNAVAAMRAINALSLANFLYGSRKVSFDCVVETMYQTGKDLSHLYRETSEGGLAKLYSHT